MTKKVHSACAAALAAILGLTALYPAAFCPAAAVFAADTAPAEPGFSNFSSKREYTDNQFRDVQTGSWYTPAVKSVYSLGIMSGKNASSFAPGEDIKISEAISMAAKTRHLYNGGDGVLPKTAKAGQRWYMDAVNYAVSQGIIKSGDFSDYDAAATRAQLAYIFSGAVPAEALPPISAVSAVPDVTAATPYHEQILLLYRAGIVSGADKNGSFRPNRKITRGEAASILSLIAVPQNRKCAVLGTSSGSGTGSSASGSVVPFFDTTETFAVSAVSASGSNASASAVSGFRDAYQNGDVPQINGRPISSDSPTLYLIQSVPPETSVADLGSDTDKTAGKQAKPHTTGELLGYLSDKSKAQAPLSIFHELTVKNLASQLEASLFSEASRFFLPDGTAACMSTFASRSHDSARYWILTADSRGQFITLVGRVGLSQPAERENEMLRAMLSLHELPLPMPTDNN